MSLSRIALRLSAVEALRGRTQVGDNVLDSPNGAIDIQADGSLRIGEERPFISVFTDEGVAEGVSGRSLLENGRAAYVGGTGISEKMTELDKETGETRIVGIHVPASDETFEFFLDIVKREVVDTLTDPDNSWADIYRSLHTGVVKVEVGAKRNTADQQRLAGHQTRITLDLIDDPVRGEPIDEDGPHGRFLRALEASGRPGHAEQAQEMRRLVGGSDPDWKVMQRREGMTGDELRALGYGPLAQDLDALTPPLADVEIERPNA